MLLYKYLSAENLILYLKNGMIRVQNPYYWNDPFEMSVFDSNYFEPTLEHSLRNMSIISLKKKLGMLTYEDANKYNESITYSKFTKHRLIDNHIVALSLSEEKDNLLMWAHYADNHKGCLLEIDTNDDFFTNHMFKFQIKYGSQRYSRPIKDDCTFLNKVANELKRNAVKETTIDEFREYSIKSSDWEYEKEWRITCNKQMCVENEGILLMKIPFHLIKEIYLGCRITPENAKRIFSLSKDNEEFRNKSILQTKLNETQFSLEFSDFNISYLLTSFEQELCLRKKIAIHNKLFLRLFNRNCILLKNNVFNQIQPQVYEYLLQVYKSDKRNDEEQIKELKSLYQLSQKMKISKKTSQNFEC